MCLGNHDDSNRPEERHIQANKYPALTTEIIRRKVGFTRKVVSKEITLKSALISSYKHAEPTP
jgi:hypothetical protein